MNEDWESKNYFTSYLIQECFEDDVLEMLTNHYKQYCQKLNKDYTPDTLNDALFQAILELQNYIDPFVDNNFEEDGE